MSTRPIQATGDRRRKRLRSNRFVGPAFESSLIKRRYLPLESSYVGYRNILLRRYLPQRSRVCATVHRTEEFLGEVRNSWSRRVLKLGLTFGFLFLFAGIISARNTPATAYESSIYTATPLLFWVSIAVALLLSIVGCVYSYRTRLGSFALLLGGASIAAILALPLVRSYRFYGLADSLTHLGWARSILVGRMPVDGIVYPSGHVMSAAFAAAGDVPISRSMMLVVFLYFIAYIVFLPLCVRVLRSDQRATVIAAFSGFLLLPILNISTHNMFHPFTLALLYTPVVFFVMFKHVMKDRSGPLLLDRLSPMALVFSIVGLGALFIHPLAKLDLLILFLTFILLQLIAGRLNPEHPIATFRDISVQVLVLSVVFFWWNLGHGPMYQMAESVTNALENTFIYGTSQAGEVVQSRQESARQVEINFFHLSLKLFAVPAIYVLAASALSLRVLYKRFRFRSLPTDWESVVLYFVVGGIVLTPYALAQFLGKVSSMFFRHVGFAMVIVTILGALALDEGADRAPLSSDVLRPLAVVGVIVLLSASLLVAFPSPYIHKPNHHVTDQQLNGYGTFYEEKSIAEADTEEAVWLAGIRTADGRFRDALLYSRSENFLRYSGPVSERNIRSGLPTYYATSPNITEPHDHYLPVTDAMYAREVNVAQEAYYSAESFETLRSQYGVHKVQSNGDFRNYYIDISFAEGPANATRGNGTS